MSFKNLLENPNFPRSNKYDPQWILDNEMGPNPLWLTELLVEHIELKPGMRVLDLGCGRALSSIFLAKEFGVQVWANDLWISPEDNLARIIESGQESLVFPIQADAHSLPYAVGFFDLIVCIDSYFYFGTDDLYLSYISRFLKPDGRIGLSQVSLIREFDGRLPEHLEAKCEGGLWDSDVTHAMHCAEWWRNHFEQGGIMKVETASNVSDGWRLWLEWERARDGQGLTGDPSDVPALEIDAGRYLSLLVLIARRKGEAASSLYRNRTWS